MTEVLDTNCWCPSDRQLSSKVGHEGAVLLHLDSGAYFGLDHVGTLVWEYLQAEAPATLSDLVAVVADRYEVDVEQCRRDLAALIAELQSEGLIERVDGGSC